MLNRHEHPGWWRWKPVASHLPERAEAPGAAGRGGARARGRSPCPASGAGLPRARADLRGARACKVLASVPDGPPMRFTWRRVTRRVVSAQGPERIAPEWWRLAEGASARATIT